MLQIFSKQAPMMDALITRFHRAKCREEEGSDDTDGAAADASSDIEGGTNKCPCFCVFFENVVLFYRLFDVSENGNRMWTGNLLPHK